MAEQSPETSPTGNPAEPPALDRTPYEIMGGEEGVRRFVDRFYAVMDELPEAKACRAIHVMARPCCARVICMPLSVRKRLKAGSPVSFMPGLIRSKHASLIRLFCRKLAVLQGLCIISREESSVHMLAAIMAQNVSITNRKNI